MGADLTAKTSGNHAITVELADAATASGLADMLHQFIEQTIADSPRKARLANRLNGRALFRAAEDEDVCVSIRFAGDHIELRDAQQVPAACPSITADFLTIAHLTSGQENPFRLLAQRRLKAQFSLVQIPFLVGMLRFMQLESASRRMARVRWALAGAAGAGAAALGAAYWYITAGS